MGFVSALVAGIGTFIGTLGPVGAALFQLAAGIVVNVVTQKLFGPKPKPPERTGVRGTLQLGADVPRSFILGRYATAGSLVYHNHWGVSAAPAPGGGATFETNNDYYSIVVALSDMPLSGLDAVIVDDTRSAIDWENEETEIGLGFPLTALTVRPEEFIAQMEEIGDLRLINDHSKSWLYKDRAWVRFYDGTQTEADDLLVTRVATAERPWTADHVGHGVAYAVVTFRYDEDVFRALPQLKFEVRGMEVPDPRGGTVATDNPIVQAWCVLRGLSVGGEWFYGPQGPMPLDQDEVAGQADICDGTPPGWAGLTDQEKLDIYGTTDPVPRYRSGIEITVDTAPRDVLEDLIAACNGRFADAGTHLRVLTGEPFASVMSVDDGTWESGAEQVYDPHPPLAEAVNAISATYPSPADLWEVQDAPILTNPDFEAEDDGRRLVRSIALATVPYPEQVQRLLTSALAQARRGRTVSGVLPPPFAALEPHDVITVTSVRNGFQAKLFEVLGLVPQADASPAVTLFEVDPEDYDWSPVDNYIPVYPSNPARQPLPPVTIEEFSVSPAVIRDAADGDRRPAILLEWTDPEAQDISGLRWRMRVKASARPVGDGAVGALEKRADYIRDVLPATEYEISCQWISRRTATWSEWQSVLTPDVRLGESDLTDAVVTKLDNAKSDAEAALARHDVALDAATGVIAELRERIDLSLAPLPDLADIPALPLIDQIEAAFGPIPAIPDLADHESLESRIETQTRRIDVETGAGIARETGLDALAQQVISLSLQLGELRGRVTDAGVWVDPATGKAGIEASGLTGAAQLVVDGLAGEISQRATYAEVNEAIASANFDPSQVADLEDVFLRLSTVEVTTSAQEASILSLTETLTVEGGVVTMATVTQDIASLQASVATKVAQTEVDDLTDRVTTAEQELAGFDGAAFSTVLRDVATLRADTDQAIYASLEQYLANREGLDALRQSVAVARQDFWARAEETDAAVAGLRVDLVAQTEEAQALIRQEAVARATADEAAATQAAQIELRLDDAETGLAGQAGALDLVEGRVTQTEDGLEAQVARAEVSTAAVGVLEQQLGEVGIRALLDDHAGRQAVTRGISQVRRDTLAQVEEGREALAEVREELTVAIGDADARITDTRQALVTETEARAAAELTLQASIDATQADADANAAGLSSLDTRVTSAEGTITAQGTAITQVQADVVSAQADADANAGAISSLDTRVTSAEGTITSQGSAITQVQADVVTAQTAADGAQADADANAGAISSLDTRVTSAEGTITAQGSAITQVQADVVTAQTAADGAQADADANAGAISSLDTRVTSAEGTITSQGSAITQVQADVVTAQTAADGAQADADANAGAISSLDTRVTSAEGTITSQGSAITQVQADVVTAQTAADGAQADADANAGAISSLDTRVTSAEGTITAQGSAITALETTVEHPATGVGANAAAVSALDTRVTSAEGDISAQAAAISALQSDVGDNAASISSLSATRVDAAGAVAAVDAVVAANFGDLSTFAGFAQWAIANEDGTNAGFRLDLGGDAVISAVRVLANGSEDPGTTVKFAGDHIILDGNTSVLGTFYTDVLQAEQAWIVSAMIASLSADKITTGTLSAERINLDGATLTAGPGGELLVNDEGVGRDQLAPGAASDFLRDSRGGEFVPVQLAVWEPLLTLSLGPCGFEDMWTVNGYGFVRIVGTHPNQAIGQVRLMRRTKVAGEAWSTWAQVGSTISSGASPGTWVHDNSFEAFGGVFEDVEYRLEGITTGGLIYGNTHRDCCLTAERRVR